MPLLQEASKISEDEVEKMLKFVVTLKEGNTYIAWSPILDETGEGDTETEAQKELHEAVRIRLQDKNMPIPKVTFVEMVFGATRIMPAEIVDTYAPTKTKALP